MRYKSTTYILEIHMQSYTTKRKYFEKSHYLVDYIVNVNKVINVFKRSE